MRTFLWGGVEGHIKPAWIKWGIVCKPKEMGGLGIQNWSLFNKALLGKWRWGLTHEQNSLWGTFLREKYAILKDILQTCFDSSNCCWFEQGTKRRIGEGNKIKFWQEPWLDQTKMNDIFPRLFLLSSQQDSKFRTWVFGLMGYGNGRCNGGDRCWIEKQKCWIPLSLSCKRQLSRETDLTNGFGNLKLKGCTQ